MKQIIMQIGKYFCLVLTILLMSSNIKVFSQTSLSVQIKQLNEQQEVLKHMVNDLPTMKHKISSSVTPIEGSELKVFIDEYNNFLNSFKSKYTAYIKEVENYYAQMLPEKYMEEIISKYTGESSEIRGIASLVRSKDEAIIFKLETMMDFIQDLSDRKLIGLGKSQPYIELLSDKQLQEWNNCIKYLLNRFTEKMDIRTVADIKTFNNGILARLSVFFEKGVNPEDIMYCAYKKGMFPIERGKIEIVFQAIRNEVPIGKLAENIISHFATEGRDIALEDLSKELKSLTIGKRVKYVEGIMKLNSASETFIKDFRKLEAPAKEYLSRKIVERVGVFAGFAAIATAAYIVNISADNHFYPGYTISNRELSTIGKRIKNGTADVKEKFIFFTSPFFKEFVQTDSVYTLSFVQFLYDIYAADEFLNAQKAYKQQVKNDAEQNVLKNIDQRMSIPDFAVGNL